MSTLREAVSIVLEGFTLPDDVRKILETAYYMPQKTYIYSPAPDAANHLLGLVDALDSAFISSWQSTAAWQQQLDRARDYLIVMGMKEPQ